MQKVFYLIAVTLFLAACGSSNETEVREDEGPALADLTGVWDATVTIGQVEDERYIIFKIAEPTLEQIAANVIVFNTAVTYDYDGDSADLGKNCYRKSTDRVIDLGYGDFEIITYEIKDHVDDPDVILDRYIIHTELSDSELTVEHDGLTLIYPQSEFDEDYYSTKLCDDSSVILF